MPSLRVRVKSTAHSCGAQDPQPAAPASQGRRGRWDRWGGLAGPLHRPLLFVDVPPRDRPFLEGAGPHTVLQDGVPEEAIAQDVETSGRDALGKAIARYVDHGGPEQFDGLKDFADLGGPAQLYVTVLAAAEAPIRARA